MSDKRVERLVIEGFTTNEAEIGRYLWMLEDVRKRLEEAIRGLDEQGLNWQPPYRGSSIGTLLYHIAAVEMDWLYCEVQQTEFPAQVMALFPVDMRDEEGRLTAVRQIPLSDHIQRLDECRVYLLDIFNTMSLADFRHVRHFPDYDVTPEWVLYHLIQHETEHLGQIMEIVQQFLNSNI